MKFKKNYGLIWQTLLEKNDAFLITVFRIEIKKSNVKKTEKMYCLFLNEFKQTSFEYKVNGSLKVLSGLKKINLKAQS